MPLRIQIDESLRSYVERNRYTESPSRYVLKSKFDYSYSGSDYLDSHYIDSLTSHRPYPSEYCDLI
jgi:hypothetical protein